MGIGMGGYRKYKPSFCPSIEDSFEALHPGHGAMPVYWALVVPVHIGRFWIRFLATFGRCDLNAKLAVGRKNAVKAREVDPWLGHQSSQLGNEI